VLFVSEKVVTRTSNIAYSMNPVNVIIFIVIGILREDPLPTGMLDVFFQKIRSCFSFTKREFMYSKIAVIYNSFHTNL
jgi:hypothetical protein